MLLALVVTDAGAAVSSDAIAASPAPQLGFHVNAGNSAPIAAAADAGAEFVVVVFSWRDIEPTPGYLYWERPDAALRAAEFYGLDVVARLDRPPTWAEDDADPTPWDLTAYARFVEQVVARYGHRLAGVIIWNEPNLALEWAALPPDPEAYAAMLAAVYPVVKARQAALPVAAAGLAPTLGDGVLARNDLEYLQQLYAAGGGAYFDVLAAHPYGFGQPPEEDPAPDRLNARRLELLREIMVIHGDAAKPVWITEAGWRTWAPQPADRWQVVTASQQRDYTLGMIELVRTFPWVERLAFWELTDTRDVYGYALWRGRDARTLAYDALVARTPSPPTDAPASDSPASGTEILAPDVVIRLGDIGTLHPHWVHLHNGGSTVNVSWEGEFFLDAATATTDQSLLLETMQIDQSTNVLFVNDVRVGDLRTRTRPDPTSTWVTQRFSLPASLLRPGVNVLRLESGLRNPVRQYADWRWENLQFRNVRLTPAGAASLDVPHESALSWTSLPSPSGWAEINRLRVDPADGALWVTGNRPGQLWQTTRTARGFGPLRAQAGARADLVFVDVLPLEDGAVLAATSAGLVTRPSAAASWVDVPGPHAYAYVVLAQDGALYAGFEERGLWTSSSPAGPWRYAGLAGRTVLDLAVDASGILHAATDAGIYARAGATWTRLPDPAPSSAEPFVTRLYTAQDGSLLARRRDSLWHWQDGSWVVVGPEDVANRLLAVTTCCGPGVIVGTDGRGLWRQTATGDWQALDDEYFAHLKVTGLADMNGALAVATDTGVFAGAGAQWRKLDGLPATVTDLLVHPADERIRLAATPAGLYRSTDAGATWSAVSPPWVVWDLATDADARVYVARADGVAWTNDWRAPSVVWHETDGLDRVTFFTVDPHPRDRARVWAGSWGNDIGVSTDGARTLRSLGNGLETLSVLDVWWHATPGQVTVGTIEGLWRSDDDGASWFKLPGALAKQTVYAVHQSTGGVIWAGAADGLWRSDDYGVTWARHPDLPVVTVLRVGELSLGDGGTRLWIGTEDAGLWLSADDGATWSSAGLHGRSVYALVAHDHGLVAATDQGIWGSHEQ